MSKELGIRLAVVQHFQSHERTELEFHPGINVIFGKSTGGKTAIFRAIEWILKNRPMGIDFKSNFAKDTDDVTVLLEFFDGSFIGCAKNIHMKYGVGHDDYGVTDEFDKCGDKVPDAVQRVANISDINIQNQLEPYFLITATAGEVAKEINKITQIEEVDEWTAQITTCINKENAVISTLDTDIATKSKELQQYTEIDTIDTRVGLLENAQERLQAMESTLADFRYYITKIHEAASRIRELTANITPIEMKIDFLYQEIEKLKHYNELYESIQGLIRIHTTVQQNQLALAKVKDEYEKFLLAIKICPVCISTLTNKKIKGMVDA